MSADTDTIQNYATPTTKAEEQVVEWLDSAVATMGGSQRIGQQAMAVKVTRALTQRRHLLVQAGTGTGKSLAYLIPALHHARNADKPVIIATATLALQAQIIRRDAPELLAALSDELGGQMQVELLKGRANYLCMNRIHGGLAETEDVEPLIELDAPTGNGSVSDLGQQVMRLRKWAEETQTGDRDELTPGVSDDAWRQVSVNAQECIGAAKCPFAEECFSELARKKAAEADIVVTNHAMLAIHSFENLNVLPEFDAVIIDEAHEFTDRVTSAVTAHISGATVRSVATAAARESGVNVTELSRAADRFEDAIITTPDGWLERGFTDVQAEALSVVHDATRKVLSDIQQISTPESKDAEADGGLHLVKTRLQEILEVTTRLLNAVDGDSHDVVWANRPGRFEAGTGWIPADENTPPTLYIAPLSVAFQLQASLLAEATTIFTSATLTVGNSFKQIAGQLGFTTGSAPPHDAIDVGSPFDYPSQGILYVAADLPAPGREFSAAATDRLEQLISASNGGALCLFSSRYAAEQAAEKIRERLGDALPIMVQGESTLATLIEEFGKDPQACLFGTMSLWQGVDVPGESLRLVTIDRIPFPRPDDPLTTARTRFIGSRGGNGFISVSATHAAIRLAQGAGRLIRSAQDRGVVAVLDSRMVTKNYGEFMTASLPNFWRTVAIEPVLKALQRLAS